MRTFINGDTLANEARMRRSVFKGAFLFVEGESDERLYGIFVDCQKCHIIICHGRENLFQACRILENDAFSGALGIADADFEHLDGRRPPYANILFTDWHDGECMMLRGAAFDRVISQFVSSDKFDAWLDSYGIDARCHLLAQSAPVGFLLWHSLVNHLHLSFDNLEVKEYLDRNSLTLNVNNLVQHVKNKSGRHDLAQESLIRGIEERRQPKVDLWQVVRGHDYVDSLGYALRYAWGNASAQEVAFERLEQCLRLAFPAAEFAETLLFEGIKLWEKDHLPFCILSDPLEQRTNLLN